MQDSCIWTAGKGKLYRCYVSDNRTCICNNHNGRNGALAKSMTSYNESELAVTDETTLGFI
jgi:hypothetical protein